mmetsp:Transcript_5145/g.6467  ORF Transcript_5145/g.6467 Transcript_5145/m.6467 type:complete len:92 (-) Transcript_5145:1197-1472(-)
MVKARVMWMVNSTANPAQIIKLTRETAFKEIPQRDITPPMLTRTMQTVITRIVAEDIEPRRKALIDQMMAAAISNNVRVNLTIDSYWTKKM